VVEFLVNQHEQIKSLFADTLNATSEAREGPFTELRRLLAVHETAEEEIVHPRAKRELANGPETVDKRLQEENEAKKVLAELETLDVSTEAFATLLSKLHDAVTDHATKEETEEFSQLEEELSSEDRERMTRTVKLAEATAPTMPHPGVESRSANLLAGPFAAMMDRARDAILGKA
jgi:hemerythrin superfamily protein